MIDLFGHEITQEAYGNMFESQQSRIAIRELFNVQSLEHALAERAKGVQSTKSARIQFIPSRGLLMELSGHIGDACWADEYPSIAEEFRNITSVLMVRHFDKHPPRMVGSMMLIETIDEKTGEEYVVIRGLNPIENFVNKTDIASFFDTVETYVNEIAMYRGKRVGLVIDTSYGRAGTNRPLLHAYMEKIKPNLRQVAVPQNSTTFNGYNISNRVYALAQSH